MLKSEQIERINPERPSRAGDAFHYRWVAKKTLQLIEPNTRLTAVVLDGLEPEAGEVDGDSVVDVTEIWEEGSYRKVVVSQLKHSTKRVSQNFTLSDLRKTFEGFAKIFTEYDSKDDFISFQIVTNRPFAESLASNLNKLSIGEEPGASFKNTIETYTGFSGPSLRGFSESVSLLGKQGSYLAQESDLAFQISDLIDKPINSLELGDYLTFITDFVLPGRHEEITKAKVLKRLGVSDSDDLFPSPAKIELPEQLVIRPCYNELATKVVGAEYPILVTAEGGIGKTVALASIEPMLPNGSRALIYDCFGLGDYRNLARSRHRHQDAFLQMINDCAQAFLCGVKLRFDNDPVQSTKSFLKSLGKSADELRSENPDALLVILIDAGDNAKMAADLFGHDCFVDILINAGMPDGVKLVISSRPERVHMLRILGQTEEFKIPPFDVTETSELLSEVYPQTTRENAEELRRLTSGNPRVQRKAIDLNNGQTINDLLASLGPNPTSFDDQVGELLDKAIVKVRRDFSLKDDGDFDSICRSLANLPPPVPVDIIALGAGVHASAVKTFATEVGMGLWLRDATIQFRDEPTETWFKGRFKNDSEQSSALLKRVSDLAETIPYAAISMPQLLLEAGEYGELVKLALEEDPLPNLDDSDRKEIVAGRLKFALAAALEQELWKDASKLALRAGEEFAGDRRRLDLFAHHVDLLPQLLDESNVLDFAFKRMISSGWKGSQNVFSAAIFSAYSSYEGDARSYLRSGFDWLFAHIEEVREERRQNGHASDGITEHDFCELFRATFNLDGTEGLAAELRRWKQSEFILESFRMFISSLVDKGDYEAIEEISGNLSQSLIVILAISEELGEVGRFLPASILMPSLFLLVKRKHSLKFHGERIGDKGVSYSTLLSLCESALHAKIDSHLIVRVIRCYREKVSQYDIENEHFGYDRRCAMRSLAMESIALDESSISVDTAIERLRLECKNDGEKAKLKKPIENVLQYYWERASIISGNKKELSLRLQKARQISEHICSHSYNHINVYELDSTRVRISTLKLLDKPPNEEIASLRRDLFGERRKIRFNDLIELFRSTIHCRGLGGLRDEVESSCRAFLKTPDPEEEPESTASYFIGMARACLTYSKPDSQAYFQSAVDAVNRFGDEAAYRWGVHSRLIAKLATETKLEHEVCYRIAKAFELYYESTRGSGDHFQDSLLRSLALLNPSSAIALISRWADRDIGYINHSLAIVLGAFHKEGIVSPECCWGFTGFLKINTDREFVDELFSDLFSSENGQRIFDQSCRDSLKIGEDLDRLSILKTAGAKCNLENSMLNEAIDDLRLIDLEKEKSPVMSSAPELDGNSPNRSGEWALNGISLGEDGGVAEFLRRVEESDEIPYQLDYLWSVFWDNVKASAAKAVLIQIAELSTELGGFQILNLIKAMPFELKERPSVEQYWAEFRDIVVRNRSSGLLHNYERGRFLSLLTIGEENEWDIDQSILAGVCEGNYSEDPESLFELAFFISKKLEVSERIELLLFGLSRIEKQMPWDYGDGAWGDDLIPPTQVVECLASLLWGLLGSPDSKLRWQAMHTVHRLNLASATELLSCLHHHCFACLSRPFYHMGYRPYELNSVQFFLFSIERTLKTDGLLLFQYSETYYRLATEKPHLVVNRISADIALGLAKLMSNVYDEAQKKCLRNVGHSQFERVSAPEQRQSRNEFSRWGYSGEIYLPYEFDEKWLYPVAQMFGLDSDSANGLLLEIIREDSKLVVHDKRIEDGRRELFESYRFRKRSHLGGYDYPKVWSFDFYTAVHALYVFVSKLIRDRPLVDAEKYSVYEWEDWQRRHSLSRKDGYWLADFADPFPIRRRKWTRQQIPDDWCWNIQADDFIECIRDGESCLILDGGWSDNEHSNQERIQIDCRLVSGETSDSLLAALSAGDWIDERDLILESNLDAEQLSPSFMLKKIGAYVGGDSEIDQTDPRGDGISNYFGQLDDELIQTLNLVDSKPSRILVGAENPEIRFEFEKWNEEVGSSHREYSRSGQRLRASVEGVKAMLELTGMNLAMTIAIYREKQIYGEKNYQDYPRPYCKHFILTSNGKIKDFRNSYQLW
ncbi:MAG: hypothetical protein ACSHX0_13415 [Akkermansiaceae bacterium]